VRQRGRTVKTRQSWTAGRSPELGTTKPRAVQPIAPAIPSRASTRRPTFLYDGPSTANASIAISSTASSRSAAGFGARSLREPTASSSTARWRTSWAPRRPSWLSSSGLLTPSSRTCSIASSIRVARGYPSFHGVVSLCRLQGPLRSLRRPHFCSGFRTPPDHALRTVEPMKPWPSSSTRPTTFRLGTLVISSISIALARAYGSGPAPFIQTMAVVPMIGGPLVLVAAIPFAGSPRGTR